MPLMQLLEVRLRWWLSVRLILSHAHHPGVVCLADPILDQKGTSVVVKKSKSGHQFIEGIFKTLSELPLLLSCEECGSALLHREATLCYKAKSLGVVLSVCPKCKKFPNTLTNRKAS